MFGERFKRIISIALILGMVATGNGFTTLANSVEKMVGDESTLDQNGPKNYYEMMYQESYYEQTTIVRTGAGGDENFGEGENAASQVLDKTENEAKGDSNEPLSLGNPKSDDEGDLTPGNVDEGPEDDENNKVSNADDTNFNNDENQTSNENSETNNDDKGPKSHYYRRNMRFTSSTNEN